MVGTKRCGGGGIRRAPGEVGDGRCRSGGVYVGERSLRGRRCGQPPNAHRSALIALGFLYDLLQDFDVQSHGVGGLFVITVGGLDGDHDLLLEVTAGADQ